MEENENVNVAVGGDLEILTPRGQRAQRARDRLVENKLNAMAAKQKRKDTEVRVVSDALQQLLDEADKYIAEQNSQQQTVQPLEQSAAGPSVDHIKTDQQGADGSDNSGPMWVRKRIKLEPSVSPTIQEDDDDVQFIANSNAEDEEMDSDDDVSFVSESASNWGSFISDISFMSFRLPC